MLRPRTDLPLDRDTASRVVPWIIALMVYLATLALAGTMVLNGFAARWEAGLVGTLTVHIPPADAESDRTAPDTEAQMQGALRVLRRTPGVLSALPLDRRQIAALLEPWLGPGSDSFELPLSRLIDVTLEEGAGVDLDTLIRRLREAAPGALVEDHALWRRQLVSLARAIEVTTLAVVALIAISAIAVVIFATQAALSTHRQVIEVLHLVGAHDEYVARQFQSHMVRAGLVGGIGGVALAVATLFGFAYAGQAVDQDLLPRFGLGVGDWLTLAVLPLIAALIARTTARLTVLRALGRMI